MPTLALENVSGARDSFHLRLQRIEWRQINTEFPEDPSSAFPNKLEMRAEEEDRPSKNN